MVQQALRGALSDRARAGQVLVVEGWDFDVPSTKAAKAALSALGITGRAMVVLSRGDERAFKSFRNLTEVDIVLSGELAAYDVLCSDSVVFTRQTLPGNSSWAEAGSGHQADQAAGRRPQSPQPSQPSRPRRPDGTTAKPPTRPRPSTTRRAAPETAPPPTPAPETEEGA